jgi:hypothetical protein
MNTPLTLRVSRAPTLSPERQLPVGAVRTYFASDSRRTIQSVLGLIWLLDGGLQFQSFMYSKGFIQMLTGMEAGQPHWISGSINWATGIANGHLDFWNTLFALTQVAIGLGLLYRPTVKPALAASFVWVGIVWWFGEAFGMLFMNMANPLTGAPGAVLLYGLIGLIVWPNGSPGGLLGVRGARIAWAALWIVMGYLWLLAPNSSANATSKAISAAPSGMNWLSRLLTHTANITKGNGLLIALVLAAVSVTIGIAVGIDWQPRTFLWLAIYLNIIYWIIGQGFGGIPTGSGTDPNAGPLFILLALTLLMLLPNHKDRPKPSR